MKFFALLSEQQQGPFDEQTVQKMISGGKIKRDILVCSEDGDLAWTPAKELFFQDSLPESFVPPPSIDEISVEQFDDGARLEIRLNSGTELKIKAVRLYDEIALAKVNSKKAEAIKMFKGVSTDIGPWGSIEWVLAASAVIGAVESVLSAGASSAGTNLLEDAIRAERQLRKEGIFFPVNKIQNIEDPTPGFWRALAIKAKTATAFVHNGDEFISVMTDDNSACSIRWSAVERHFYSKPTT